MCKISAKSNKLYGSWSSSKFSIFQTNNINNIALSKFRYQILHNLISIIKLWKNQSGKDNFKLTTQTTLSICDALSDLVSVTIWRLYDRSNICKCMLMLSSTSLSFYPFVWVRMAFKRVYQISNVRMPINVMYVNVMKHFHFHCSSLFSLVPYIFIYLLPTIFLKSTYIFMFSFGWLKWDWRP